MNTTNKIEFLLNPTEDKEKKKSSEAPSRTLPRVIALQPGQTITETQISYYGTRLYRKWDAGADRFALSEHNAGNSADDIAKQLITQGYATTRAAVVGSLYKQGVPNARLGPMPGNTNAWNSLADAFTLAGFNANKSVSEILAGLTDQGFTVTEAEVRASLSAQGESA